jgi:hypothetical protein
MYFEINAEGNYEEGAGDQAGRWVLNCLLFAGLQYFEKRYLK